MFKNRRKKLDKNLALSIFLQAFDRAGIERKNTELKTPGAYEILAEKVISSNNLDAVDYPNYERYIKDRFNDLKRLQKNPGKNTISFYTSQFIPLQKFADGLLSEEVLAKVLFRRNVYSYFNFWRMPSPVTLLKKEEQLFLEKKDGDSESIGTLLQVQPFSMPRDKGDYWLKLIYKQPKGEGSIYVMPELLNDQPDSTLYLRQKLKPFLHSLPQTKPSGKRL